MHVISKYDGWCWSCGHPWTPGIEIAPDGEGGWVHAGCDGANRRSRRQMRDKPGDSQLSRLDARAGYLPSLLAGPSLLVRVGTCLRQVRQAWLRLR